MWEPPTDAYRLTDHWWWRPGWRVGSRYYAWHLLLDDQPTLVQLAQRYQSAVAGFDALDPIPEPWLHITLQGVGHIEDVTGAELDRTFQAVGRRAAALRLEPLEFRRATIFGEGVVLVPSDPTPLAESTTVSAPASPRPAMGPQLRTATTLSYLTSRLPTPIGPPRLLQSVRHWTP